MTEALDADPIRLTADGKIIDFLHPDKTRVFTPEERVRQTFARKLHHEYGYAKEVMVFEAPVNIGSETRFADIAIYRTPSAAQARTQGDIALIVETKAPTEKKGVEQLTSYIFASSADGGMWVNDNDAPRYFRRQDVPARRLAPWPNIPRAGLDWDSVGQHRKANLRPPHNLVETFRRCHNALYRAGIDSSDLAMDMVRIILAKYRDETNEGDICEFRCTPLEAQSAAGREKVAARVRLLFEEARNDDPGVFDPQETIGAGNREIVTVVSELQDFRFVPDEYSEQLFDVVGAAYEVYVGSHLKGDRGQYFTPRLVVQLLVRIISPDAGDIIVDPSMGSGGFLIAAMRHVIHKIRQSNRSAQAKTKATQAARGHLYGIDKSPKLVKIAKTNMILASDGHAGLVHGDTLEPPETLPSSFVTNAGPGRPTVILTNPPFGATSEHRITADKYPEIVEQFNITRVWSRAENGRLCPTAAFVAGGTPPEYLFLERCLRWLAPGGRLGIVVPRGVLSNVEALPLRTLLLREAIVLAIINCHDDTFKPHTDAKASLIVCRRKEYPSDDDDDYPIFMAISQAVGHTALGRPIYKRTEVGDLDLENGHPVIDHDLDAIYEAWRALSRGDAASAADYFQTSRRALHDDLNLNPTLYLPRFVESRARAREMGERPGWRTVRLGEIADVYSGPRFTRPYAGKGVTSGPGVVRYFTGNAATQTRGENIKYLDLNKAKPAQLRDINKLWLRRGMILVTRSGTTGRVVYATAYHDGAVGTEDLNRIEIHDLALRGYVYQFLLSQVGQDQIKQGEAGGLIARVEPAHLRGVLVPLPEDVVQLEAVGLAVIRAMEEQESVHAHLDAAETQLDDLLAPATTNAESRGARWDALMAEWDAEPPMTDEQAATMDEALRDLTERRLALRSPTYDD